MLDILIFIAAFAGIIFLSTLVAKSAEDISHILGEPYGTMVLTFSAVMVEVIIIAILMSNGNHPTLARDAIYSAVMIDIAGILGFCMLIGGYRHIEQKFNKNSSNSYLGAIIVAIALPMIASDYMPEYLQGKWLGFCSFLLIVIYVALIFIQSSRHVSYFKYAASNEDSLLPTGSLAVSIPVLVGLLAGIALLSEFMSHVMDAASQILHLPYMIAGILVAVASAAPEIIVAIKQSLKNNIQSCINIAFGASLATVLLTVPMAIILSYILGVDIVLGLTPIQIALLSFSIVIAYVTTQDGETNVLEGTILFSLFLAFLFHTCIA